MTYLHYKYPVVGMSNKKNRTGKILVMQTILMSCEEQPSRFLHTLRIRGKSGMKAN